MGAVSYDRGYRWSTGQTALGTQSDPLPIPGADAFFNLRVCVCVFVCVDVCVCVCVCEASKLRGLGLGARSKNLKIDRVHSQRRALFQPAHNNLDVDPFPPGRRTGSIQGYLAHKKPPSPGISQPVRNATT